MNHTLSRIIRILIILIILSIIFTTIGFTYTQIKRSQTLDEGLVSNLTTQLDIRIIDQAISKISPPSN